MRILIADDEELVRYSVRNVLEEIFDLSLPLLRPESPPVFLEAATGSAMAEIAREVKPDLVFADIRMPGQNGLEAIDRIRSECPGTLWVILSGYSEFEYARKALILGVLDYLVKPVDPLEMTKVVEKAAERLRKEWQTESREFEQRTVGILNNLSSPEFDPFFSRPFRYGGLLLSITGGTDRERLDCQYDLSRKLRKTWRFRRREHFYALTPLEEGTPALIAAGPHPLAALEEDLRVIEDWNREQAPAGFRCRCRRVEERSGFAEFQSLLESSVSGTEEYGEPAGAGSDRENGSREEAVSSLVRRAREYGETHCGKAVGVAQAAEALGVTPNYLSSCFHRSLGITFTRFITELRMEKARELLAEGGCSVKEVAAALGYQSSRHFARLFRESFGCAPSEFRESPGSAETS